MNATATPTQEQTADAAKRLERAKRIIRGLLDRTTERGFTEEEAMESAVKLGALLEQHNLELTDVMVRDVSDMVTREVYAADPAIATVITGIGRLCSLVVYRDTGSQAVITYKLFGHAPDVEFGLYLYEVCAEAAETGWVADMQVGGYSKAKRDSFRMGFAGRVCDRLEAIRDRQDAERRARMPTSNCTDLVVLKDQIVKAEWDKIGVKLTYKTGPTIRNIAAYRRGQQQGSNVNLERPLEGPGSVDAIR